VAGGENGEGASPFFEVDRAFAHSAVAEYVFGSLGAWGSGDEGVEIGFANYFDWHVDNSGEPVDNST
jgi:hypothetical protein